MDEPSNAAAEKEWVTINRIVADAERGDCLDSCIENEYIVAVRGVEQTLRTSKEYELGKEIRVCRTGSGSLAADRDCPGSGEHTGRFLVSVGLGMVGAGLLYWRSKRRGIYPEQWDPTGRPYPRFVPGTAKAVALGVGLATLVQTTVICVRPVTGPIVEATILDGGSEIQIKVANADRTAIAQVNREWVEDRYPSNPTLQLTAAIGAAAAFPELGLGIQLDPDAFEVDKVTVYRSLLGGNRIWMWSDAAALHGCAGLAGAMLQWVRSKITNGRQPNRSSELVV